MRRLRPGLRRAPADVIDQCLRADPADRPTVQDVHRRLGGALTG